MTFKPWPNANPARPPAVDMRAPQWSSDPRGPKLRTRVWRLIRANRGPGLTGLALALLPLLERVTPASASWRAMLLLTSILTTVLLVTLLRRGDSPRSAVEAAEAERARVVRDLHDGAQQRLVHTVIALRLAHRTLRNGGNSERLVEEAISHAEQAIRELRELAHGILPDAVTRHGLRKGIESLATRVPVDVKLEITAARLTPAVEANAYFLVAEALTNVVKHARARAVDVRALVSGGTLRIEVRDDGTGGAQLDGGPGLQGMRERIESLGGRLRIESPWGGGTLVMARLPLHATADCARSRLLASDKVTSRDWRGRFVTRKDAI
jgi:signal transduction histidine kinase